MAGDLAAMKADPGLPRLAARQPLQPGLWLSSGPNLLSSTTRPNGPRRRSSTTNGASKARAMSSAWPRQAHLQHHAQRSDRDAAGRHRENIPTGRWVHVTSTYDGNSKAEGMHLYVDGRNGRSRSSTISSPARPSRGPSTAEGAISACPAASLPNRPELVTGRSTSCASSPAR